MTFVHIELFSYRDAWRQLPSAQRQKFLAWIQQQIDQAPAGSTEIVAFAMNESSTDRRAPYDFCCIFKYADRAILDRTLAEIAQSDWYGYFEQVNLAGPVLAPAEIHHAWARLEGPAAA